MRGSSFSPHMKMRGRSSGWASQTSWKTRSLPFRRPSSRRLAASIRARSRHLFVGLGPCQTSSIAMGFPRRCRIGPRKFCNSLSRNFKIWQGAHHNLAPLASAGRAGLFSEAQGERLRPGACQFHLPVGQPLASVSRSPSNRVPFLNIMRFRPLEPRGRAPPRSRGKGHRQWSPTTSQALGPTRRARSSSSTRNDRSSHLTPTRTRVTSLGSQVAITILGRHGGR